MLTLLALLGASLWIIIFVLPWKPWSTAEALDSDEPFQEYDPTQLTILIPARNEEAAIASCLRSIALQGPAVRVVLVDDQSTDRTAALARESYSNVHVISGSPLPDGWAGKMWALEQARREVQTPLTLLLDADIELQNGMLGKLLHKQSSENLDFISLMAALRMNTFWEKLLIPAYIYFFKLLYPFRLANDARFKWLAAAAGGCILVRTECLEKIGGFSGHKSALIDDCSLAKRIKAEGFKTWIGLTRSVTSHRGYDSLGEIWNLVARFAFTYLHYSFSLLIVCSLIMFSLYAAIPLSLIFQSQPPDRILYLALGLLCMFASYGPIIRYYRLSPTWILSKPLIGILYLAMTWSSAFRYMRGRRSEWKGRVYSKSMSASTEDTSKNAA